MGGNRAALYLDVPPQIFSANIRGDVASTSIAPFACVVATKEAHQFRD